MRPQPLIAVGDVHASRQWYRRLLGLSSNEGNPEYARLFWNGQLILQLHSFDAEHDHVPIGNPDDRPYGNGLLLWFETDEFDAAVQRAREMGVEFVMPPHRNPRPNHWECWMRDPDGYIVVVASPDGSASGNWRS